METTPLSLLPLLREYLALKKRQEEFLLRSYSAPAEEQPALQRSLEELGTQVLEKECAFTKAGLKLVFPHEKELESLDSRLAAFSSDQLTTAFQLKQGEAYDLLKARVAILRFRYRHVDSIVKLNLLFRRLGYTHCTPLIGALRLGQIAAPIDLSAFSDSDRSWILRLFQRLEFAVSFESHRLVANGSHGEEMLLTHANQRIWLSPDQGERFLRNAQELIQISPKIQLCNAERQVRTYSEEEEKKFEELQGHYLSLLKVRDELLQSFYKEEKLFG